MQYVYRKQFVYPQTYKRFYKVYQPLAPIPRPTYNFGKFVNFGYTPVKTVAVNTYAQTEAPVAQVPIPAQPQPVLYQKTFSYQPIATYNKEVRRFQNDVNI